MDTADSWIQLPLISNSATQNNFALFRDVFSEALRNVYKTVTSGRTGEKA